MVLHYVELSPAIGVDIDYDLRRRMSEDDGRQLRELLDEYQLLLFRSQDIDQKTQAEVVGCIAPALEEHGRVSNDTTEATMTSHLGEFAFHQDFAFGNVPLQGISLRAIGVAPTSATTSYVNCRSAYLRLPQDLRDRLNGVRVAINFRSDEGYGGDGVTPTDTTPAVTRPVLFPNPRNGLPVLFTSTADWESIRVVDADEAASAALLAEIGQQLYEPGNIYEHRWTNGDLIIWDNVAVQHARGPVSSDKPRVLARVTFGDIRTYDVFPSEVISALGEARLQAR